MHTFSLKSILSRLDGLSRLFSGSSAKFPMHVPDKTISTPAKEIENYFHNLAAISPAQTPTTDIPKPTPEQEKLFAALDKFFAEINFQSEAESIKPENVTKAKKSFKDLCNEMDWPLILESFKELFAEKRNEYSLRADGITPNWYHEFRELLPFLSMLRQNVLTEEKLKPHGGIETLISSILRHDSWEDFAKTPTEIYARLEKRLHDLNTNGIITDDELFIERNKAAGVANLVDLMTRKIPKIDHNGQILLKKIPKRRANGRAIIRKGKPVMVNTGKVDKTDRFGSDLNYYHQRHLSNPLAVLGKFSDSIEGLSTRIIVHKFNPSEGRFSTEDNIKYAEERRSLYGRRATDEMASTKYPEFAQAIKSMDNMAGITLVILETINDYYKKGSTLNPRNGTPIRIQHYLDNINPSFCHVPAGFSPDMIQIERLEKIAERDLLMAEILAYCIYPSIIPINPKIAQKQKSLKARLATIKDQYDSDSKDLKL